MAAPQQQPLDQQLQHLSLGSGGGAAGTAGATANPFAGPPPPHAGDNVVFTQTPPATGAYPMVPPPAPNQPTYPPLPSDPGVPQTYAGVPPAAAYPAAGAGWTAESVQPASAATGQHGHYGHLQYAPSFNTASGAPGAGPQQQPGAAAGQAAPALAAGWVLTDPKLPQPPAQQIIGPMVRLNDFDPATGEYALSVLVVSHPSLAEASVQLHWGVNCPASQLAAAQVLDDFMGYKFYRFDVSLVLQDAPGSLNYIVGLVGGQAPLTSHSIILPARHESWRFVAYSCNGFHEDEPEHKYGGIANLWKDLLQRHGQMRFHLQIGGGDQAYCDRVYNLPSLQPWLSVDEPQVRAKEPFTPAMLQEVEQFYFGHYGNHFSDPPFAAALAQIPFVYSWDDHDIFDGWGSYPDYLQQSAVFQGMFAVARRFFLLFQMHCRYDNAAAISKTLGEFSYHQIRNIGDNVLLLAPDTRSERTIHQVLPPAAWDMLFAEVNTRLAARPGAIHHLLVLLPVPIVYPKIPVSETMLATISGAMANSKAMRDAISKLNLPSGAVSQFNEPDLLDDLLDHWTSADHVQERQALVRRLQVVAETHSVRVTFISGDVHVGAFGCFQSHPKQHLRVIDPRFMLQVVSSAIGNEPPPPGVITVLETSSMASTAMGDTLDKMIKAFDGKRKLKGARNYCEVVPLHAMSACCATGAPQPPGSLSFTLRIEQGPPGQPTGIETVTQTAPVLLAGPRAAEAQNYAQQNAHIQKKEAAGIVTSIASVLPEETGKQLQAGVKAAGHKIANFLGRF